MREANWKFVAGALCVLLTCVRVHGEDITHAQGEMAGEVTVDSVILQSRLTTGAHPFEGGVPGSAGVACFEVSETGAFVKASRTGWLEAVPDYDFIVKTKVTGLKAGTRYYYRLLFGKDTESIEIGSTCTFMTLPGRDAEKAVSFVVVTGLNYAPFQSYYRGDDRAEGYPALETILGMGPDFFVGTGDNVYYDTPVRTRAKTREELRKKWQEQFVQPRFVKLFAQVSTYWEKDDHDYRYNDCDPTGDLAPSHALGAATFLEQVPIVDPEEANPVTYRTHRMTKDLQIWFVEGRDYRSSTMMSDGPGKTLWGAAQTAWLMRTLLESDATFKILISPTPMIGPDDHRIPVAAFEGQDLFKRDNHSNPKGYQHERDAFFAWLIENGFLAKHFYIVCGDRHWQYHSIHPTGVEEFSCGALIDENSRLGRRPGDPDSNDPDARIVQPYTQDVKSGGFLKVTVKPAVDGRAPTADFTWFDEHGVPLYTAVKVASE